MNWTYFEILRIPELIEKIGKIGTSKFPFENDKRYVFVGCGSSYNTQNGMMRYMPLKKGDKKLRSCYIIKIEFKTEQGILGENSDDDIRFYLGFYLRDRR